MIRIIFTLLIIQAVSLVAQDTPPHLKVILSKLNYNSYDSNVTRIFFDPRVDLKKYMPFFRTHRIALDDSSFKALQFGDPIWRKQYGPCCGDTNMSPDNPNRTIGYLYQDIAVWTWMNSINSFILFDDKESLECGLRVGLPVEALEEKIPGLSLRNKNTGYLFLWCGYTLNVYYENGIISLIHPETGTP